MFLDPQTNGRPTPLRTRPNLTKEEKARARLLLDAIEKRKVDEVVYCLRDGATLIHTDKNGNNAFHIAAATGFTAGLEKIVTHGIVPDINCTNKQGYTALQLASMKGHAEAVTLLLKENADYNVKTRQGKNIYQIAGNDAVRDAIDVFFHPETVRLAKRMPGDYTMVYIFNFNAKTCQPIVEHANGDFKPLPTVSFRKANKETLKQAKEIYDARHGQKKEKKGPILRRRQPR